MPKFAEPFVLGNLVLKNRFVVAPEMRAQCDDLGYVNDRIMASYADEAKGGAALVTVQATYITPEGQGFRRHLSIKDDSFIPGLHELAYIIKRNGAIPAIQLFHAGSIPNPYRLGYGLWPVGPTELPIFTYPSEKCKELAEDEILRIIDAYGAAAARAKEAGFEAIDIHAGHGGLIQQFLSRALNKRTDKWGQQTELFSLKVLESLRKALGPDYPIIWRISADEFSPPDGYTIKDTVERFVPQWDALGVTCYDVSGGGIMTVDALGSTVQPVYLPRGFLLPLAKTMRTATKRPLMTVGKIMDPELAEHILEEGFADLIRLGRPITADPEYPQKAIEGRYDEIRKCISCNWCLTTHTTLLIQARCTVNAAYGREREYKIVKADRPKKVMIVGGGVGGMETARVATLRGHTVTLYERSDELGGLLNIAARHPRLYTRDLLNAADYLIVQMEKLGIDVQLETQVTPELVEQEDPDVVVIATGSVDGGKPDVPGIDRSTVVSYEDYLKGTARIGERVVVAGCPEGAEVAVSMAREGKDVTIIDEAEQFAPPPYMTDPIRQLYIQKYMQEDGVKLVMGVKLLGIGEKSVEVARKGETLTLAADTVVLAPLRKPNSGLAEQLKARGGRWEIREIGDCVRPASIAEAIDDAAFVARDI